MTMAMDMKKNPSDYHDGERSTWKERCRFVKNTANICVDHAIVPLLSVESYISGSPSNKQFYEISYPTFFASLYYPALKRKTLLMLFEKPSLRTRVSLETGMTQMGGHGIAYMTGDSPIGKKETYEVVCVGRAPVNFQLNPMIHIFL